MSRTMKGTPLISAFKVKNSVAQWEEAVYMTPFKALWTRICTDMWVGRNKVIAHHQKQSAETYHEVPLNKNGQQAWLGEHRKHGCSDLPSRLACPTVARFAGISRSELDSQSWMDIMHSSFGPKEVSNWKGEAGNIQCKLSCRSRTIQCRKEHSMP